MRKAYLWPAIHSSCHLQIHSLRQSIPLPLHHQANPAPALVWQVARNRTFRPVQLAPLVFRLRCFARWRYSCNSRPEQQCHMKSRYTAQYFTLSHLVFQGEYTNLIRKRKYWSTIKDKALVHRKVFPHVFVPFHVHATAIALPCWYV